MPPKKALIPPLNPSALQIVIAFGRGLAQVVHRGQNRDEEVGPRTQQVSEQPVAHIPVHVSGHSTERQVAQKQPP